MGNSTLNESRVRSWMSGFTCNLLQRVGPHVQHHSAIHDAAAELKKTVQRQSGDVRFTPPLAAILNVFLKLQPPTKNKPTFIPSKRTQI